MDQLVFIENGEAITDSLTVAEVFKKEHFNVINDVKNQISKLIEAGEEEWGTLNFQETQYQHPQNKQWYPKFNMTEDGFVIIAMSYVTPEAMKMKVKFINEFKRIKEELQGKFHPKSQAELIAMLAQLNVDQEKRLKAVEERVEETEKQQEHIKEVLSLHPTEWRKKVNALLNKIATKLGGFEAYRDIKNQSYEQLEERAKCDLDIRLKNRQRNMALEGASKSKIKNVNKLDVIDSDTRLTEIYLAIIKEMAIRHNIDATDIQEGA